MTQHELAKRVGVHPTYLNQVIKAMERGTFRPRCSIELAIKIEEESGGLYLARQLRPDLGRMMMKLKLKEHARSRTSR